MENIRLKNIMFYLLLVQIFSLWALGGIAQALTCVCPTPGTPDFLSETSPYISAPEATVVFLHIHVLRLNDGSGGLNEAEVDSTLAVLGADFEAVGIHLRLRGQSVIDNSTYYNDPLGNAASLFATNPHDGSIDIYIGPNSGDAEGEAEGVPSNAAIVTGELIGTSGVSHVIGHCLGLYHTVEVGWGGFTEEQGNRMRLALFEASELSGVKYETLIEYVGYNENTTNLTTPSQVPRNAAAIDFTNNGKKDMLVCSTQSWGFAFSHDFINNSGIPVFAPADAVFPEDDQKLAIHAIGTIQADFDNDGDIDFYVPNRYGSRRHQFFKNNDGG